MSARCRFDDDVRQAAMTGRWTRGLSSHANDCEPCREVRLVADALRQPHPLSSSRSVSDPSALWACGRHARRIGVETRIEIVVTATEIGVLIGVLGVLITFVDWRAVSAAAKALSGAAGTWTAAAAAASVAGLACWVFTAIWSRSSRRSSV